MATIVLAVANERLIKKTWSAPTPARERLPGKYCQCFVAYLPFYALVLEA